MKFIALLSLVIICSCHRTKLPSERYYQYDLDLSYHYIDNELQIDLKNSLRCPMRIWVKPEDPSLAGVFEEMNPITIRPLQDTVIRVAAHDIEQRELNFASRFGDVTDRVVASKVELPFQEGKSYKLVQGYNSSPTHNSSWSRYALDFGLQIGDTICSATSGYVVGVIEEYTSGGANPEWRDFANQITIYDPTRALFTQYVHLSHGGSLVKVGDLVEPGVPIGISGMTGYTNVPHLHFNCLEPVNTNDGLRSIEVDSIGDYKPSQLKRNEVISNWN